MDNLSEKNNRKLMTRGKNCESIQESFRKRVSRESSNIPAVRGRKHVNRVKWQGRESSIEQWQEKWNFNFILFTVHENTD